MKMLPRISLIEGNKSKYMVFSTKDVISQHLFTNGSWENHLLYISKIFYDFVDSPLVLDVGANLGAYTIPISIDIQSKNGKVIAFEPQRIIFYQLCANVFLNRLDNCFPFNCAVSDNVGKVDIPEFNYADNNNIGAFSLSKDFRELHGIESSIGDNTNRVDAITLDSFPVDRPPALIKIDVEGYEINVLKGSLNFLEQHNYPPVLFEVWGYDWFAEGKKELLSLLKKIGYKLFQIDETNFIAQHSANPIEVDFRIENGVIVYNRVR